MHRREFLQQSLVGLTAVAGVPSLTSTAQAADKSFAGFPEIGKHRPGERTLKVITSDAIIGLRRPKWTRAMSDLGGWTAMVATAKPPYSEWEMSDLPVIAEGHHFFELGGHTFLGSRANYSGDHAEVNDNPPIFDNRRSYTLIYDFTADRQLKPWAVVDSLGDCSYPFLVETPTEILCAYYSQHEDGVCKPFLYGFDEREFLA